MLSAARCVVHSLGKLSATNINISTNTNTNTHYFLSFLFIFTIASFLVLFFYCLPFGLLAFLYLLWIPTSFEVLFTFLELVYSFINPPRLAYTLLCIFFFFSFLFCFLYCTTVFASLHFHIFSILNSLYSVCYRYSYTKKYHQSITNREYYPTQPNTWKQTQ